jgi:hypothetical protein
MKQDNVLYILALFALVFLRISKPKKLCNVQEIQNF